jgi:hypothetical protein
MHALTKKLLSLSVVAFLSVAGCDGEDTNGDKAGAAKGSSVKSQAGSVETGPAGTRVEAGGAVVEAGPGGTRVDDGQGNLLEASEAGAVVKSADGSSVTVDKDGNVKIQGADGKTVEIDGAGVAEVK